MSHRTTLIASTLIAASLASGSVHAELQARWLITGMTAEDFAGPTPNYPSPDAYYDTDLNITWLANANVNGAMTWADANAWAASLVIQNQVNGQTYTYDNWRLPTALQPDVGCSGHSGDLSFGSGCTGSEMGHLFYSELGGAAGLSLLWSSDPDVAKFSNLQVDAYWSATALGEPYTGYAWNFSFASGMQDGRSETNAFYALAVSPGDVGIAAIPEADTWAMLLAGLGLVGVVTRRKRRA